MSWIYFLAYKYEAFEKFIEFKVFAEKESRHVLEILYRDRGDECTSNDFMSFCKKNGIQRQLTCQANSRAQWRCGKEKQECSKDGKKYDK